MAFAEPEGEARTKFAQEVAELFPPQGQWPEEACFSLPETNRYIELSEGELIILPYPARSHQRVVEDVVG
ncbi:MAG: hypothetical protein RMK65_00630 [Anaerolineae bacterium]|nr:hypothetical protein [Anaerolineae bacterium]MCX8066750.1 hypothetical protein [Anaerolineae bacterium]MDW7990660.1 hypothetical protein [Anaerolineae bacterium]